MYCGPNGILSRIHKRLTGRTPVWEDVCHQHDCDYIHQRYGITRKGADRDLRLGVAASGHPIIAWVYWSACRLLGWWWWNKNRLDPKPDHFERSIEDDEGGEASG
jgi:hypothetical protein